MNSLQEALNNLTSNERYLPVITDYASDLHDVFETILLEALTSNPGAEIDGPATLAVCMQFFKELSKSQQPRHAIPVMSGLPSQEHARRRSANPE